MNSPDTIIRVDMVKDMLNVAVYCGSSTAMSCEQSVAHE